MIGITCLPLFSIFCGEKRKKSMVIEVRDSFAFTSGVFLSPLGLRSLLIVNLNANGLYD